MVNIYNLEKDELRQTNLPNTHHGDYTEWRLNTLQNTLKKQTKEAMGCCCVALLFYVQGKHLRSCRDGQLT